MKEEESLHEFLNKIETRAVRSQTGKCDCLSMSMGEFLSISCSSFL